MQLVLLQDVFIFHQIQTLPASQLNDITVTQITMQQQQVEYPPPYQQMTQPVPHQSVYPPQEMMQPPPEPGQPQVIVVQSGSSYKENYAALTPKRLGIIQVFTVCKQ